jgi:2-haloacid dehalogenase
MAQRPKVVAFDIFETTFDLSAPMRERFAALGLPESAVPLWFTSGTRDAFALAATCGFAPFKTVLAAALDQLLAVRGLTANAAQREEVLATIARLPPQPEALESFQLLADAGIRAMAVSNGARATTEALLDRAGLRGLVEHVISVEDVRRSKPWAEVYRRALEVAKVAPAEMALVATHAWDVHGARAVGLTGAFVARGQFYPSIMNAPDVVGESLSEAVRGLATLPV